MVSAPGTHRAAGQAPVTGYRPQLDGVRAVAVGLVVLFHLGLGWFPGGFVGVDVFFVLSGYLITGLLVGEAGRTGGVSLTAFYARRARRLLPAVAVVLLAVSALSAWLLDAVQQQLAGKEVMASALWVANWHFAFVGGDYFGPGDVPGPLTHMWSLGVEEQFYLLWPAAFVWLWARRRPDGARLPAALVATVAAAVTASAVAAVVTVPSPVAYFGTHTRIHQLLGGAGLSLAVHGWRLRERGRQLPTWIGDLAAAGALAAVVVAAATIDGARDYPGTPGLVVTAASLLLLLAIDVVPNRLASGLLGHRLPAAVGRLSFSLYLWHWPAIVFLPLVAVRLQVDALANRAVIVAVAIGAAALSSVVVERPVRFRFAPRMPAGTVIVGGLVVALFSGSAAAPWLQPRTTFAAHALHAVTDRADPGPCPYFADDWPAAERSEPCVVRHGDGAVVAVVGDSHAQQWLPAFESLAADFDLTLVRVTRGGCPANDLAPYVIDENGRTDVDHECADRRRHVYRRLVDEHDPDVVFVASRSSARSFRVGDRNVRPHDPDHVDLWASAWGWTVETLASGGARVVLSATLPTLPQRVPACLADAGRPTARCDFVVGPTSDVAPYNAALTATANRTGALVVDPTALPCPDGRCRAMVDGVVVHRDDNHLSATFVRSRADDLAALLAGSGVTF